MSTVILGGGIIGSAIAYYLSAGNSEDEVHVVEQSPELFSSASGYAAGFLARDWFEPSLASLGALSFNLHHQIAAENDGDSKWGFMRGTAFSLDMVSVRKKDGSRGDDWLREGNSRAETATGSGHVTSADWPLWLTRQQGGVLEQLSQGETVAQVDPLRLSKFLIDSAISRGVKLHNPAKATDIVYNKHGNITGIKMVSLISQIETTIPCTNLVFSSGAWTSLVLNELFPLNKVPFEMTPLAGYSLLVRSLRYTLEDEKSAHGGRAHAVFATHPQSCGFSPEIFTRKGGEIYIAGLNPDLEVPFCVENVKSLFDPAEMQKLKEVAVRLLGNLIEGSTESTDQIANIDDLEVLREGLCFRPVGSTDVPTICKIDDALLGGGAQTAVDGGVYIATGHGPWGISLSLGTGKVVSEMINGQDLSADVSGLTV